MWKDFFYKNENNEEKTAFDTINKDLLPAHVAIIMDGNGRWAKKEAFPVQQATKRVSMLYGK